MRLLASLINCGFMLLFTAYYCLPSVFLALKFKLPFIIALLYLLWVICFQAGKMARKKILSFFAMIFLLTIGYYLVGEATSFLEFFNKFFYFCMDFIPLLILYQIIARGTERQARFCVLIISLALVFTFYKTISALQVNPDVTRQFLYAMEVAKDNIGTYDFSYAMGLFLPLFTLLYMTRPRLYIRVLCIVGIVIAVYYMLIAQYTLCLLISFAVSVYLFLHKTNPSQTRVLWVLCLIMLIVLFPTILRYLITIIPSDQMARRLGEILNALSHGDFSGENINARSTLYLNALKKFIESPILGNASLGMDSHSTILAVLGHLGIFGMAIYINIFRMARKYALSLITAEVKRWKFNAFFIYYILVGLTNPINSALTMGMVIWLFVPLVINLSDQAERKRRHKNELLGH